MADGEERTFSIWPLLGLMAALGAVGLYLVLALGGSATSSTGALPADPSTTTTTVAPSTSAVPTPTFPGGEQAPERIREVRTQPGEARYIYRLPAELSAEPTSAVVAPTDAKVNAEGTAVEVTMTCAPTLGSVPAGIVVNEDPVEVRVTGIAVGFQLGEPCPALQVIETLTIPLDEPLGVRRLVVDPPGTKVDLSSLYR